MGRKKEPVKLLLLKGKTHLSKKEIAERMASEIQFGTYDFKMPTIVKNDKEAAKKWRELIALFTKPEPLGLISTADAGLIERYCLTYSEYIKLKKSKLGAEIIGKVIDKKLDLLLKMERELLLTPAAKIRSSGKNNKKQEKQSPLQKKGFGYV